MPPPLTESGWRKSSAFREVMQGHTEVDERADALFHLSSSNAEEAGESKAKGFSPRALRQDFTIEALLASSDASSLLGGWSFRKDNLNRSLSHFVNLWDGDPTSIDRRNPEAPEIFFYQRCLTALIMGQVNVAKEGKPTCMSGETMEYIRTDPETGAHLFRCRTEGCPLKTQGPKAITHCDTEVWERPEDNLRVLGPLPRFTAAWKRLYSQRMSIERIFRSLKHSRGLERHCVMGMRKIKLLATLSVLTFQATTLTRLKAKDPDRMRDMGVTVA